MSIESTELDRFFDMFTGYPIEDLHELLETMLIARFRLREKLASEHQLSASEVDVVRDDMCKLDSLVPLVRMMIVYLTRPRTSSSD